MSDEEGVFDDGEAVRENEFEYIGISEETEGKEEKKKREEKNGE